MTLSPPTGRPVVVIDDHELFSTSLTFTLCARGFEAVALPLAGLWDVLPTLPIGNIGLVVLDLDLGEDADGNRINGADLVEGLRQRGWTVLVVTGSTDPTAIAAAIAAGAVGSVAKAGSLDELVRTVSAVLRGEQVMTEPERHEWLERNRRRAVQDHDLATRLSRLSPREQEVLALLTEGMRASAIAMHFVVSMPTVRSQIRSILVKLQVTSQLEAVAMFHRFSGMSQNSVERV
ncbi:response regulator transcription factor [Pseudonocardia kongjuensis]|uniref:Response regulator transcription factor n=1 Tax=Pseudonocardia kongjuensis TaxID=102227 RepID=A0ABP4I8D9_9PSEU